MSPQPEPSKPRFEVLREPQCRALLASRDIGRIAFPVGGDVEIFPVNYATDGIIVVFRTGPGSKLEHARGSRVTFEVDSWDPEAKLGWSVVIKGVAKEVTSGSDPFSDRLRDAKVTPLPPGTHDHWMAVYPTDVSGRRFQLA